jgi:hypothetical protein
MTERGAAYISTPMTTHAEPTIWTRSPLRGNFTNTTETIAPYKMLITASRIDVVFCIYCMSIMIHFAENNRAKYSQGKVYTHGLVFVLQ